MLSEELETLRHFLDSARLGEIQILPEGAAQISRFLERAEREVRRLEVLAAAKSDADPGPTAPAEDRQPRVGSPEGLGGNVVALVPRASRPTPGRPDPGGAA